MQFVLTIDARYVCKISQQYFIAFRRFQVSKVSRNPGNEKSYQGKTAVWNIMSKYIKSSQICVLMPPSLSQEKYSMNF